MLGFVRVCAIELPEPALAPVIPPVTAPTTHANELAVLAVSVIFVDVLLQIEAALEFVTTGVGLTVTVIV